VTALARRAVAIVEAGRLRLLDKRTRLRWATRTALHEGDISQARFYLGRASRLRPLLTYALPVVSVQALVEMAHSYIGLADPGGAAAALMQVTTSSSKGQISATSLGEPPS